MPDELQQQAADAAPASTEPAQAEQQPGEVPAAASAAVESSIAEPVSVTPASTDAGTSSIVVSSAEQEQPLTPTFEQRVEERFLQLENFLVKMPLSIAYAFHQGSATAEEMAQRAIKHLFGGE